MVSIFYSPAKGTEGRFTLEIEEKPHTYFQDLKRQTNSIPLSLKRW